MSDVIKIDPQTSTTSRIVKKTTKNGDTYYRIFNIPLKTLNIFRTLGERKELSTFTGKYNPPELDNGIPNPIFETSYRDVEAKPKSFSIFVNKNKIVLMPYVLTAPPNSRVISKERLIFSFRKNRMFIYWMGFNRKKIISNRTLKHDSVMGWIKKEFLRFSFGDQPKLLSFLANILLKKGMEYQVIRKMPPKNLRSIQHTLALLVYPTFQGYSEEGHKLTAVHSFPKGFLKTARAKSAAAMVKKVFGLRGKKKGFIREALESCKMHLGNAQTPETVHKYFSFSPLVLGKLLFDSTQSLDYVQSFFKEIKENWAKFYFIDESCMRSFRLEADGLRTGLETSAITSFLKKFHPNTQINLLKEILVSPRNADDRVGAWPSHNFGLLKDAADQWFQSTTIWPSHNFGLLKDAADQWFQSTTMMIDGKSCEVSLNFQFSGIQELHDKISVQFNKIKTPDFPIHKPLNARGYEDWNIPTTDLFVEFPTTRYQLIEWGATMNNCIASYAERARDKSCLLVGIAKKGILTYTIEVDIYGEVRQFYGKHNSQPDPKDRELIEKFLRERKILMDQTSYSNPILGKAIWDQYELITERTEQCDEQPKREAQRQ